MNNVEKEGSKNGHLGSARISKSNGNVRAILDPGKAAPKPNGTAPRKQNPLAF